MGIVPSAGYAQLFLNTKRKTVNPRRKITAIILPNLPHDMLIGWKTLQKLGLLPPGWPNVEPRKMDIGEYEPEEMSHEEKTAHALMVSDAPNPENLDEQEEEEERQESLSGYTQTVPD